LDPDALHVVRDPWWNSGVRMDSQHWGLPFGHYFNSGFLVLKRELHLPLLHGAAKSWGRHPSPFRDQPSLNGEAFHRQVRINWMHRDYNVIGGDRTVEAGKFPVKGLHLGGRREEGAFREVIAKYQGQGAEPPAPDGISMAGTWIYERGGKQRELEFWEDGMIGRGGAACERYWRIRLDGGVPTLAIFGAPAGERNLTETLRATRDGNVWRGRWLRFGKNGVVLRPAPLSMATSG
jgi:hypothetical protein